MSGLPALSIELPAACAADLTACGPRPADRVDAPVTSPVHKLQGQLQRLTAAEPDVAVADAGGTLPGWLRLTLPLGMSEFLWASILWATGALRAIGLTG